MRVWTNTRWTRKGHRLPLRDARQDRDRLRFWFRGEVRELADVPPSLSVLHWLREREGSTGTKEGCNQGDCGACTVVLAESTPAGPYVHTANSCLLPMPMLHGRALFTVEDVGVVSDLHPLQRALVEHGGSQCGFCTPGFVMSLWSAAEQGRIAGRTLSRDDIAESISGNLCRCTGYRPILDAAFAAMSDARPPAEVLDPSRLSTILVDLDGPGTLRMDSGNGGFVAPDTEDALAMELHEHPSGLVVSGGSDLMLAIRANGHALRDDLTLVWTDRVATLRQVEDSGNQLSIGATARLDEAWAALVVRAPGLERMHRRFASPAIRSVGTIGGNIVNGSPIADLTPVLIALDAAVILRRAEGTRTVPLAEFGTGVRTSVLQPGEFLSRIVIPMRSFGRDMRAYKVSRRFDDDISTVSATFALALESQVITDVRVVFGGMATTVRRAAATESALRGREWNAQALADAQAALSSDFTPISDHRATAHYRERAAAGLLHRWWLETGVDAPAGSSDVWATP
jgi:xanthine dehydrogenase small subunit